MELFRSLSRHLTVQNWMRLLNSGTLKVGRNLCVTVAIDHLTVDGFHDELKLSAKTPKERCLDESVKSKNFIWFVEMNITSVLRLTYWNSTNSGAQDYPKHSSKTSGTLGEKFGKELFWWQTLSRWTKKRRVRIPQHEAQPEGGDLARIVDNSKKRRWTIKI